MKRGKWDGHCCWHRSSQYWWDRVCCIHSFRQLEFPRAEWKSDAEAEV